MKKVLIGAGIGCGALIIIGIVVVGAGAFWAKGKMQEAGVDLEAMAQGGQVMEQQQKRAEDLNQRFAFDAPPKGQPVKLTEPRLQTYMDVRAGLSPAIKKLESEGKRLDQLQKSKQLGVTDAWKGMAEYMAFIPAIQNAWLDQLEQKQMSPAEFHAITATLLSSEWGKAAGEMQKGQRQMLTQLKAAMQQQANDANLPQQARDEAKKQLPELEKQIAALPPEGQGPSEADTVHQANAALFEKYKDQFEKDGNLGIDVLLFGYSGNTFENVMQGSVPDFAEVDTGVDAEPADENAEQTEQ